MSRRPRLAAVLVVTLAMTGSASFADELPRRGARLGVDLTGTPLGARIERIEPGSAAEDGGLRRGDVLVALAGEVVREPGDVIRRIGAMRAGATVEIGVLRDGERLTRAVVLKPRPPDRGEGFEVLYHHVVSRGARIRTIVTRPRGGGRHPALFLIQGLGAVTIDEPLAGPSAYSRILQAFASGGYVTVRVEKPGIGDSEGSPYVDLDFDTELDTYRQALIALKAYAFVDPDQVFIFGHSIGGVFGPILASESPVRGLAAYGTLARTWTEYLLENTRRQAALMGTDPGAIDATLRALAVVNHRLIVDGQTPEEIRRARPDLGPVLDRFVPEGRYSGRIPKFWAQVAARNLPVSWAKGDAAVLVIWGRHDFIATEADHPLIAAAVNRARPGRAAYVVLEGSDHAFRQTVSIADSFRRWNEPPTDFNPAIVTTLKEWTDKVRAGR